MLLKWIARRRALRRAWQADARDLILRDEANAYHALPSQQSLTPLPRVEWTTCSVAST
jgi:hypothetical protein